LALRTDPGKKLQRRQAPSIWPQQMQCRSGLEKSIESCHMSLIAQLTELQKSCARMAQTADQQQRVYFSLIDGMVKLNQQYRVAKNYVVSDALRKLLEDVGVKVQQGTAGYEYDDIPKSLRGRPVQDTWSIDN
jgi:cysteinyl-tRNA synthetase